MPNAERPSSVERAHDLLLTEHPEVREEYERLRPRYEAIAALIRARKGAGVTQSDLAERMGRPQSVISEIESGRRSPRIDTLAHAARVLGYRLRVELDPLPAETAERPAASAAPAGRAR